MDEQVNVLVRQSNGEAGFGYYVWEAACEDEGYVAFFPNEPSADQLREICPQYVVGAS